MFSFPSRVGHYSTPTWCLKLFSLRIPAQLVALQISFLSCSVTPYSVTPFLCCLEHPLLSSWPLKVLHKSAFTHSLTDGWFPSHQPVGRENRPNTVKRPRQEPFGLQHLLPRVLTEPQLPSITRSLEWRTETCFFRQKYVTTSTYSRTRWSRFDNQNNFLSRKNWLWSSCWQLGKRGLVTVPATHSGVL